MEFEGKVALVTGAGQGIGHAIALYLAQNGAKVVIDDAGVNTDGTSGEEYKTLADKVVAEITQAGGQAVATTERVGTFEAGQRLVKLALSSFGQLDILVNNAAIMRDRMIFNMSRREWHDVINVNLTGTFAVMRAALPHMRRRKTGRIINIVSTAGIIGNTGQANYAASKGGIIALTRVCALDMARYNVTANCVTPFAYSRATDQIQANTPELASYLEGAKKVAPEHVSPLIGYLCSDRAQGVSGQLMGVRGKEIFLFSEPQRRHSLITKEKEWTIETLAKAVDEDWAKGKLTQLRSDLEAFSYPPFV